MTEIREQLLLDRISEEYKINEIRIDERFGTWGTNIRWKLIDSNDTYYFLKEKPHYLKDNEFRKSLLYQQLLLKNGILAPKIYLTLTKHKDYFRYENRCFVLMEWIHGIKLGCTDYQDIVNLGGLAGEISLKTKNIIDEKNWKSPRSRYLFLPEISKKAPKKYYDLLKFKNLLDSPEVISLLEESLEILNNLEKRVIWGGLTESWIHGDLHHHNVIRQIETNKLVAFDFDDCHWGYSLTEVAWQSILLGAWYWPSLNDGPILRKEIDFILIEKLLNGVSITNLLSKEDYESLPYFLGVILFYSIISIKQINEQEFNLDVDEFNGMLLTMNEMLKKILENSNIERGILL